MIIKHLTKLNTLPFLTKFNTSEGNQLITELRTDLVEKLESMDIRKKKSIFIEDAEIVDGKKKNNYMFKILTKQQKSELGILIPHPTFPLRMTRNLESKYRKALCEDLYHFQHEKLGQGIRILQLQTSSMNIDEYINSTYKDIFTRYMISRGLGVEWEAKHSAYGVVNPADVEQNGFDEMKSFYGWLIELMQEYEIERKEVLGLYSYGQNKFVSVDKFDVENVYKIGYFFTLPLTKFGKFSSNFEIIKERGQSIELLFMAEDAAKLLNIEAFTFEPNKKMIILSKFNHKYSADSLEQELEFDKTNSYLITSLEVYTDHIEYFTAQNYQKHSTFNSEYLLEMEVQGGIKIFEEIDGYSRKGGVYAVDRYSGLPDFERVEEYGLVEGKIYLEEDGRISVEGMRDIKITDVDCSERIVEKIKDVNRNLRQLDIYSSYTDQIFSYNSEKLHFKTAPKYQIPIPSNFHEELNSALSSTIISESKIEIPTMNQRFSKPKDRRQAKKNIRNAYQQKTNYMGLMESLESLGELSISSLRDDSGLTLPVFVREGLKGESGILMNKKIKEIVLESLIIKREGEAIKVEWNNEILNSHLEILNRHLYETEKEAKIKINFINLTPNLLNGYKCFKNYSENPQLSNVVIEPQSKTEDVVPYFFHLHFLIHKMMIKQKGNESKGRRTIKSKIQMQYSNKLFSLIKFHPTIDESQKNRSIDEVLFGVLKANSEKQYGYGLEALRFWVARNDSYLGDRRLVDKEVNKELELGAFIRKVYWEILPLMEIDLSKIAPSSDSDMDVDDVVSGEIAREKLTYLHQFMLDHIDYYILNMEECYKKLDLNIALCLTEDFFKNYVDEIFIKTVRKRMISYPLAQETKMHIYILKKILDLAGVISPLLPYSVYHISKIPSMKWPEVQAENAKIELIPGYNRMTKLRVEIRNKILLNNFHHSEILIEDRKGNEIWNLGQLDLELFFGIDNISIGEPNEEGKSFRFRLSPKHPIGEIEGIKVYEYRDVCMRCSPNRNYGTHLCGKCLEYLNKNFGKLPLLS